MTEQDTEFPSIPKYDIKIIQDSRIIYKLNGGPEMKIKSQRFWASYRFIIQLLIKYQRTDIKV